MSRARLRRAVQTLFLAVATTSAMGSCGRDPSSSDGAVPDAASPAETSRDAADGAAVSAGDAGSGGGTGRGSDGSTSRDGGADAAGGADDAPVGAEADPARACLPGQRDLAAEPFIDVHVTPGGYVLVRPSSLSLVDRTGARLHAAPVPREITASAFDGTHLVVADRALATVYDTQLRFQRTIVLTETCAYSTAVVGGRWICGGSGVFDLATGQRIDAPTAVGSAARLGHAVGVPGLPYLVRDSRTLLRLADDGTASFAGTFEPSLYPPFVFLGRPGTQVIDAVGNIHKYDAGCAAQALPVQPGCVMKEGVVGTLRPDQRLRGLAEDGARIYTGLISSPPGNPSFGEPDCSQGCLLQQIDVGARLVTAEKAWVRSGAGIVGLRYDPTCDALLVLFRAPPGGGFGATIGGQPSFYGLDLALYR